jgi:hypothetical protein
VLLLLLQRWGWMLVGQRAGAALQLWPAFKLVPRMSTGEHVFMCVACARVRAVVLAAFTLPKVYELKKDEIDSAVDKARTQVGLGPRGTPVYGRWPRTLGRRPGAGQCHRPAPDLFSLKAGSETRCSETCQNASSSVSPPEVPISPLLFPES